jgi:hypothetical protein
MSSINMRRVITGGLVAGLILNIIDVFVNVSLLGEQWIAGSLARGTDPKSVPLGGAGWVIVDFIAGVFLVWLYAAIRPRYGPGPKTALVAGFAMWFIAHAILASFWFMGVFPPGLIAAASLGALVSSLVAAVAGCAIYKE